MKHLSKSIWEKALLVRKVEEALLALFQQGHINGTVHTCIGQELIGVAIGENWLAGDYAFSNHRGHGHFIGIHRELEGFMGELLGRACGVCGGHGGSQHLCHKGFFSNGILGSTAPIATGLAKAIKRKQTNNISFLFIGDGALGEGAIYEAFNLAAIYQLPLYVICERNRIAQSTPTDNMIAGSIKQRALGFGFEFVHSSTNEPDIHFQKTESAINALRLAAKPVFHLVDTQRLMSHSKSDDTRPQHILDTLWSKDPLVCWLNGLNDVERRKVEEKATQEIENTVNHALEGKKSIALPASVSAESSCLIAEEITYHDVRLVNKINHALTLLLDDKKYILLGEDIESPYGGAFKVTDNLSVSHPGQVINSPISESGIVGLGIGLAMAGYRPIVEIMFGDFLTLCFDLLVNSASKFPQLFNGQVEIPLLIRTPMGGRRGYGATHSQSIEKHFLGVPNLQVVALNYRHTVGVINKAIKSIKTPTIMVENKQDYSRKSCVMQGYSIFKDDNVWPCYVIRPHCPPLITVFCYGGMLKDVEDAAVTLLFENEIALEIICPTQLYPFDSTPIMNSLYNTQKMVCIEEGCGFSSLTSEVLAMASALGSFDIHRISGDEAIISAAKNVEAEQLPNTNKIVSDILNWLK